MINIERGSGRVGVIREIWLTALACAFMMGGVGCSTIGRFAHTRANEAAYTIIEEKQRAALGEAGEFSIDRVEDPQTRALLERVKRLDFTRDGYTTPTATITLDEALGLGVVNNRDYKSQREALFAQALGLTATRRDFGPIYNASGEAKWARNESGNDSPLGSTIEKFGSRGFTAGVNSILATGATIGLSFSHQFVRFLDNPNRPLASNSLSFSAVQPLLNGFGPLVTLEPLRQEERSMIYAVRTFRRYQQNFIIDVAARYYALLSRQDQLINAAHNYDSVETNWKKLKRYAGGGKSTQIEVDQAYQKVLESRAGLISSQNDYSRSLDDFKFFLGLPIDLDVAPDRRELEALAERGLLRPEMTLRDAMDIALAERLDLMNTEETVEDARRKLKIAEQNFLPTLNAFYNYSTTRGDDKDRVKLDFMDNNQTLGVDVVLPMDWTLRRNRYRLAQLTVEQAERNLQRQRDSLLLEVRDAWRALEEQRTNYEIQTESVKLADRRVKSTTMMLQMGRATVRDMLEAQDALLASQNAATSALISHTIQRLRFWNAIERLEVDAQGMWQNE